MLEIYDRVLPSRSVPTLVGIAILALVLYGFQGVLDIIRGRVFVRIAGRRSLDEAVSQRVYQVLVKQPLKAARPPAASQPRPGPVLSVDRWPIGFVRSAMDAALSRHLLPFSSLDWDCRDSRRALPHRCHAAHRTLELAHLPERLRGWRTAAIHWPKQAGAMPRRSRPWVWRDVSGRCGMSAIAAISRHNSALARGLAPTNYTTTRDTTLKQINVRLQPNLIELLSTRSSTFRHRPPRYERQSVAGANGVLG